MNHEQEEKVKERIQNEARDMRLSCATALALAKELKLPPRVIGDLANQMAIKLTKCQLGCF